MTDKPIIFSGLMIRALLEGRKTQTRRILKPQPDPALPIAGADFVVMNGNDEGSWCWINGYDGRIVGRFDPKYRPGDRLWVREAFVTGYNIDEEYGNPIGDKKVWYRATDSNLTWFDPDTESTLDNPPWKPSIHMPRWASRLTLSVTDVRVQRLQDISEDDAFEEGATLAKIPLATYRAGFRDLWNSIHGSEAWSANPWVAATSFDVHHCNIDRMPNV